MKVKRIRRFGRASAGPLAHGGRAAGRVWKLAAKARRVVAAAGGPPPALAGDYGRACAIMDEAADPRAGIGALPLLPALLWAARILIGTATVVGGYAIVSNAGKLRDSGTAVLDTAEKALRALLWGGAAWVGWLLLGGKLPGRKRKR